ncbi:MAG: hypothetical protein LBJ08_00850, partial [Bifidobacteriaceae bacterium]|nr:hypothetical protein [Bifidobacteriaceae bacterium]
MNRYEALEAPTSLKMSDLAVHIRMHPGIPAEISGPARSELINVRTRLHDELTTVRYGRNLPTAQLDGYREVCRAVSGSDGEPIAAKFFALEFAAFLADVPDAAEGAPRKLEATIGELDDPWRIQAWAAQVARIARDAETSDPSNAVAAWARALRLYRTFFARGSVEDSYTFRNDKAGQEAARAAWGAFLMDEVREMSERMADHGKRQEGAAVAVLSQVLASREVAAIDPSASGAAQGKVMASFVDGVAGANCVEAALGLYQKIPADIRAGDDRGELDRALLGVMTKEAGMLEKGFGDTVALTEAA